ncbi:DUF3971 domain-containing protein [Jannaschia sp. W003]|uniref:DUF3971 domain-containing protein n=1 Tax=Jannaschia sp. W003 TaxID=2867012 RepID=UPI0021A7C25C|nr:DUF3971 domain-containing protein [Jannaschia sp. W003]UWQ20739.1 DUF3971 domain-containing protein [Jannaschia sp. W003]
MVRRSALHLLRLALLLALVAAGLAAGTAVRLAHAPAALPRWAVERIEARANRGLGDASVSVGGVALAFDRDAAALRLVVRGAVLQRGGTPVLALPALRVALDGGALLRGRVRPRAVVIERPEAALRRGADGRWSLAFGGGGGRLPANGAEALAALDAALASPLVEALEMVRLDGARLLVDAPALAGEQIVALDAAIRRRGSTVQLEAEAESSGAVLRLDATRDARGVQARLALEETALATLMAALPGSGTPPDIAGRVRVDARMRLAPDGTLLPVTARAEARDVAAAGRVLDRTRLRMRWMPGATAVELPEIAARGPGLSLDASGRLILPERLNGPVSAQARIGALRLDPDGLLKQAARFDDGALSLRITRAPLRVELGRATLSGPSGALTARGTARQEANGWHVGGEAAIPRMAVEPLRALWPPAVAPGARRWFAENVAEGTARYVRASLRAVPGAKPVLAASFGFEDATVRWMRTMPPATGGRGALQLQDGRLAVRLDSGTVQADEAGGVLDVAGTRLVLPDVAVKPIRAEIALRASGAVGDVLRVLDRPPFRLMERIGRTPALVSGRAEAAVAIALPLRPGNAPADVAWNAEVRLADVVSERLIPGRRIEADALDLRASWEAVEIAGDARFEGVPFRGTWRQPLPPPRATPGPGTPPRMPPGRLRGTATATPEGLARLGIALDAVALSGRTAVALDVALPPGGPPRLSARSDLRGMAARIPAIGWRKAAGTAATLEAEATLGSVPEVTRLSLEAPGLRGAGRVTLRPGGALEAARFEGVRTPWFRGAVAFQGRGRGKPPEIRASGASADLRGALAALGEAGGGGSGEGAPVAVTLDRLQITDGIALGDLRARLGGGSGEFSGRVNGGPLVAGTLEPDAGGTVVRVRSDDAGAVLRAAGLFRDARGGAMRLTLAPSDTAGVLRGRIVGGGIRVRDVPAVASLLQALSVVGLVEQLGGQGLPFETVEADFTLGPSRIDVRRAAAVGPSMSITADGVFDMGAKRMDIRGVVSPIYFVNGLFGALFARRGEGLFGFTYRLAGATAAPSVSVDPLSILTPGRFRDIFRRAPPSQ